MSAFLFVAWVVALYALVFNLDAVSRGLRRLARRLLPHTQLRMRTAGNAARSKR